jgi:hypothetical protein
MEAYIVYMELLSGHEEIITKSGISLNARTLNRGFTVFNIYVLKLEVCYFTCSNTKRSTVHCMSLCVYYRYTFSDTGK